MKVELWLVGKTKEDYLKKGMEIYLARLKKYLSFEMAVLPDVKNASQFAGDQLKEKEGAVILEKLKKEDFFILLDERGARFSSEAFAQQIEQWQMLNFKRLVFQVGGAYGFSPAVYQRANASISLSDMTFSHQMIRLFFLEQLYRAMTILKGEPYHNA